MALTTDGDEDEGDEGEGKALRSAGELDAGDDAGAGLSQDGMDGKIRARRLA
jgi:hypothetical protein